MNKLFLSNESFPWFRIAISYLKTREVSSYAQSSLTVHLLGVLVGLGVEVGLGVFVTTGVAGWVAVAVAVGPRGQVVSLKRKLNDSSGALPARPATWIVTLGSKFVTTMLNTSEAPFLKLLNLGRNSMLAKPGLPVALVHVTS